MQKLTIEISNETDRDLKDYLSHTTGENANLSAFVEEAVQGRLFDLTVGNIKERNSAFDQQAIMDAVDEAVTQSRASRS